VRLFEILNISFSHYDAIKEGEGEYNLLSELRLIRGMTDEVYDKIKDYLTVYGDNKININTAGDIVLTCLLNDKNIAQGIITYRQQKNRFEAPADIKKVPGVNQDFNTSDIAIEGNFFSVISTSTVNDVENKVDAVLKRNDTKPLYWRNQ
jgi:type II secretory pathway component PulK